MSYNILDGGNGRLDLIETAINAESPDVLVINEANGFLNDDAKIARSLP